MDIRFRFLPVASSLHDPAALAGVIDRLSETLGKIGGVRGSEGDLDNPEPIVFAVLTGGTEGTLIELWRRRVTSSHAEPVHLLAHPGQNSLPAAMEALAGLRQRGANGRILPFPLEADAESVAAVDRAVRDLEVRAYLRRARLGLVGAPSDWLVASSPSAEAVRRTWGLEVVPVDISVVVERYRAAAPAAAGPLAAAVSAGAIEAREPNAGDVADAARLYPALSSVAADDRLDALTVRCFDLLGEVKTSGCVALSQLLDDGVVAGCEGDLASAVAMTWTGRLLEVVPWMANPAWIDRDERTILLAHCTVARSLVSAYRVRSHFESGIGVGIEGDLRGGDVTLIRVGGRELERLWVADGEAVPRPAREGLCRTQLTVRLNEPRLAELLRDPLGNHLVVVPGHHADHLREWWELMVPVGSDRAA
ncbi:MAG TPA: fucose isomerase [Actinomycetota bacterium]